MMSDFTIHQVFGFVELRQFFSLFSFSSLKMSNFAGGIQSLRIPYSKPFPFILSASSVVIEHDNFWVCSKFTSLHIPISLVYSQSRNSIAQVILVIIPLLVDADDSEAPGGLKADEDNWQLFVFVQDDVIEVPAVAHGGGGGAVAVVPVPKAIETGIILLMYQVTADFGTS